jgi:hypothetical protein
MITHQGERRRGTSSRFLESKVFLCDGTGLWWEQPSKVGEVKLVVRAPVSLYVATSLKHTVLDQVRL